MDTCPTCNGTERDPRNRKRECPDQFCRGGAFVVGGMCDCDCHDEEGIRHFMPCCTYTYLQRSDYEIKLKAVERLKHTG